MSERWDKLLDGELERWLPDIEESIRNGDFTIMEHEEIQDGIKAMQESAEGHYEDAPMGSMQEVGWMQNRLLAEIALQLAKQNEVLEQIVKQMKIGIVVEQA